MINEKDKRKLGERKKKFTSSISLALDICCFFTINFFLESIDLIRFDKKNRLAYLPNITMN